MSMQTQCTADTRRCNGSGNSIQIQANFSNVDAYERMNGASSDESN